VGQVHHAIIKDDQGVSHDVMMKIQHMYSQIEARDEMYALGKIKLPLWAKRTVDKLDQVLKEELDFRKEGANLEVGKNYIRPELGLDAITSPPILPPTQMILVMNKARGKMINTFKPADWESKGITKKEELLLLQGTALTNLFNVWFSEALFGQGRFHADPHPGNIFFELTPNKTPGYHLTLIDFGSVGRLSVQEQKGIILAGLGLAGNSPEVLMKGVKLLTKIDPKKEKKLLQLVKPILESNKFITDKISDLVTLGTQLNIEIPESFIQFNRGKKFLTDQIYAINDELDQLDPDHNYPRLEMEKLFLKQLSSDAKQELKATIASGLSLKKHGEKFNLRDLISTGGRFLKKFASNCLHGDFSAPIYLLSMVSQQISDELVSVGDIFSDPPPLDLD
jgi:predicted unusual protein kinase regulating ubiquinone biosynthesis (AarF/ABC1/UbiB family)